MPPLLFLLQLLSLLNLSNSTTPPNISSSSSGVLRRISSEWSDCRRSGNGYDWQKLKKFNPKKTPDSSSTSIVLGPFRKSLLLWHFSFVGAPSSPYSKGVYHGRIILPSNYPLSPPKVQMLTPSGRFIPKVDICLSASSYHPESWTPKWTVKALVQALQIHMLTDAKEIGGMECTTLTRELLATNSRKFKYNHKGKCLVCHETMLRDGVLVINDLLEEAKGEEEFAEEVTSSSSSSSTSSSSSSFSPPESSPRIELSRTLNSLAKKGACILLLLLFIFLNKSN